MSSQTQKLSIDGKHYKISDLTETAIKIVGNLDRLKVIESEKKNMIAILNKAKKAYIQDLKSEMISVKSGFDFSE